MAPIRIVRVITRLNIGGPSRHVVLLSRDLDDGIEFQTTLVSGTTAPHEGDMVDYAHANGVGVAFVPTLGREISPADDLVSLARLVKLMRQLRPDVVHTHMAKAGTVGRLAAMVCRVPLIVHTYHGHVFHSYFGPLKTRVFITIERALGMGTSRIVDGRRQPARRDRQLRCRAARQAGADSTRARARAVPARRAGTRAVAVGAGL